MESGEEHFDDGDDKYEILLASLSFAIISSSVNRTREMFEVTETIGDSS